MQPLSPIYTFDYYYLYMCVHEGAVDGNKREIKVGVE